MAGQVSFVVTGATTVINYFGKAANSTLPTIISNGLNHFGEELVIAVKAHASGHPGPNVITGHYRDSIYGSVSVSGVQGQADAYTDMEFGRRLEYGGVSRTQNKDLVTKPYPHFRPALQEVGAEFIDYLQRTIRMI